MDQGPSHEHLAHIDFSQTTEARWYSQDRWESLGNDAFTNRLTNHTPSSANERNQFQLDMVMLEVTRRASIGITQEHFQSLLRRFEVPASSVKPLFNEDGRHTRTIQHSRVNPGGAPVSLCISMQTPSLEFDKEEGLPLDSISVLLRISPQTSSAACIVIARNPGTTEKTARAPTTACKIAEILHRNYRTLKFCPPNILNLLCSQFDGLNERYWMDRRQDLVRLQTKMHKFCEHSCEHSDTLYDDGGMAIFNVIHELNVFRHKLLPLNHAMEFQLSALSFMQTTMEAYQKMQPDGNRSQFPQVLLGTFHQEVQDLEAATKLRQNRLQEQEKWADLSVEILRSSNAQHDTKRTLDDSVAVKVISFVTLIFLPVFLVATISSSNAFDVEDYNTGNGVKVWNNWWILLVITLGLIAVVLVCGFLYLMKRRSNALSKKVKDFKLGNTRNGCPYSEMV
ncbi:hypothetical protein F5Y06DRAFT_305487 [Hypoxylon sp. FL0890]|nr:hypothetical protein F5Y06DRAFT_305487 [Hypoxylon sp. FL0890]